jgi:putative addiction module killer protein
VTFYSCDKMGIKPPRSPAIVESIPLTVEVYENQAGKVPYSEWLLALKDKQAFARISLRIDRAKLGNLGDHKLIDDGLWEMRVDTGAGYRIYFGRINPETIVLLWGGDKSTQQRDIEKATEYWTDYRSRD